MASEGHKRFMRAILRSPLSMVNEAQERVIRAVQVEYMVKDCELDDRDIVDARYYTILVLMAYRDMLDEADAVIVWREQWEDEERG